jgi:hypothetical protein
MTGSASLLIAVLTFASAPGAHDAGPRAAITRESIRRAVEAIDVGDAIAANTQSDNDWRAVTSVKAGADTRVVLDDWRTHRGRFQGADERSVTLEIGGVNRTFLRAQVRQVEARGGPSASNAKGWAMAGMPLTGMMIGSLAGAIFGATRPSWNSIYAVR